MGTITSAKFLGATVESFSANAGWNEQSTTLDVTLVEDAAAGDQFFPPEVGQPVSFNADGFSFQGILQYQSLSSQIAGNKIAVKVTDPREILAGVAVLLNSLITPAGLPNVVNAYGYWEAELGFGGSLSNESGMVWDAAFEVLGQTSPGSSSGNVGVRPAVELLTSGGGGSFSCPILFKGNSYNVDLSGLPTTPAYYRVGGVSQSLLDLVSQLCQDAGCDYMVYLDGSTIRFKNVSRTTQPSLGQIAAFVESTQDAVLKSHGTELRNDYTNALLIGGDVNELTLVQSSGTSDMTIWPYWGEDAQGNVVVGQGDPAVSHTADVDASEIADIIGATTYNITLPELRCAMAQDNAYESWATFVMKWFPDKAQTIGLVNTVDSDSDLASLFPDGVFQRDLIVMRDEDLRQFGRMNESDFWTERANRVFNFVQRIATEYYGVKFLVQIPFFLSWKVVPDTLQIVSSSEVSDGGYLPESSQPLGIAYQDINLFQTEDGRFTAFGAFPFSDQMNLSAMSPENFVVSNGGVYLKATVDNKIVYPPGSIYPYVVMSLAEPLFLRPPDPLGGIADIASVLNVAPDVLLTAVQFRYGSFPVRISPAPFMPTAAAIPLKDNRLTYGPWGTFEKPGVPGKTYVERDESLTPWQYGGWDVLNLAATARLAGMATDMQTSEVGEAQRPGLPTVNIGDTLVAGGPNVTNISCVLSTSGVTTSYQLRTYTPQFGAFQRQNADRLKRLGIAAMQLRRSLRAAFQRLRVNQQINAIAAAGFLNNTANVVRQATPVDAVFATMYKTGRYGYRTQVAESTLQEFAANVRTDNDNFYSMTGGMSLEGLYRPFSTAQSDAIAGDMPHFETPLLGVSSKTCNSNTINPIADSDIDILVSGQSYGDVGTLHRLKPGDPGSDDTVDYDKARPIGRYTPMSLVGWGREYTGKPFPNAGDETQPVHQWSDNWSADKAQHPEKWRAGPLAVYFDNWLKVWTVPTFLKATLDADMTADGVLSSLTIKGASVPDKVMAYENWLGSGTALKAGTKVWLAYCQHDATWNVIAAACQSS